MNDILENIPFYILNLFKYICIGFFIPLLGGVDNALESLFILTCFDIFTGILKGIKNDNIFSNSMYKGFIFKKPSIYIAIAVMYQIDKSGALHDLGFSLREMLINACIIMEGVSILENLEALGFPIPTPIKNVLASTKQKKDNIGENNDKVQ